MALYLGNNEVIFNVGNTPYCLNLYSNTDKNILLTKDGYSLKSSDGFRLLFSEEVK